MNLIFRLPLDLVCEQCILQWTYVAGNNWGDCDDGTSGLGCGPQEHFRLAYTPFTIRLLHWVDFGLIFW